MEIGVQKRLLQPCMASRVGGAFERTEGHSQSAGDFPRSVSETSMHVSISKEVANETEILAEMAHQIRIIISCTGTAVSGRQRLLVKKKDKNN
jgi:hypothetical protein